MASTPHQPRWKTENANWNLFQEHVTKWAEDYNAPITNVDKLEEDQCLVIIEAAGNSIPVTKPSNVNMLTIGITMTELLNYITVCTSPGKTFMKPL